MSALGVFVAATAIVLALDFEGGNVYVPARIADSPLRLIVDTGGKGGLTGGLPADGLLGMEFLRPYVARFDYAKGTLALYSESDRDEAMKACNGHDVPLVTHPLGFWSSEMTTDHGAFRFVWDSGATYSFIAMQLASARRLPLNDDLYETKSFILGTTDFGPLDLVALDLHVPAVDVLLGYNFFRDHVICFDGPRSAITIAR
jgi:hypothetical protein